MTSRLLMSYVVDIYEEAGKKTLTNSPGLYVSKLLPHGLQNM